MREGKTGPRGRERIPPKMKQYSACTHAKADNPRKQRKACTHQSLYRSQFQAEVKRNVEKSGSFPKSPLKSKQLFYLFFQKLAVQGVSELAFVQVLVDVRETGFLGQYVQATVMQHISEMA